MFFRQASRNMIRRRSVHSTGRMNRVMNQSRASASTASSSAFVTGATVLVGAAAAVGVASLWAMSDNEERIPAVFAGSCVPHVGVPGTKHERTFIAIKPDGVQRNLIGEVIRRFEAKGYKLVGLKMVHPTVDMAKEHYIDLAKKPFYNGLCKYFSSGPIIAMCWEGQGVIKGGRDLVGATDPAASLPGSFRGDFAVSIGRNIIHGSDAPDSAAHELTFWFKQGELVCYDKVIDSWIYE